MSSEAIPEAVVAFWLRPLSCAVASLGCSVGFALSVLGLEWRAGFVWGWPVGALLASGPVGIFLETLFWLSALGMLPFAVLSLSGLMSVRAQHRSHVPRMGWSLAAIALAMSLSCWGVFLTMFFRAVVAGIRS